MAHNANLKRSVQDPSLNGPFDPCAIVPVFWMWRLFHPQHRQRKTWAILYHNRGGRRSFQKVAWWVYIMAVNPTAPATATPKGQHLVFHSIFSSPPSKFLWCTLPDWMMQHGYKHRAICRENHPTLVSLGLYSKWCCLPILFRSTSTTNQIKSFLAKFVCSQGLVWMFRQELLTFNSTGKMPK